LLLNSSFYVVMHRPTLLLHWMFATSLATHCLLSTCFTQYTNKQSFLFKLTTLLEIIIATTEK
jgi:hypothetical protein